MNLVKTLAAMALMGTLVSTAAFAAPRGGSFQGKGPVKVAPSHAPKKIAKAKKRNKKQTRKMAHGKKTIRPKTGRPGSAIA